MSRAPPAPDRTETPEARLAACQGLIRDAAWRCANRHRREREPMFQDMAQEATIAVFLELKNYPTAPGGYIWQVAYRGALRVLRSGRSVDSPRVDRHDNYQVFSLEAVVERDGGWDAIEETLAKRKRRGEMPDPTGETAVARLMYQDLWECLTPRQRQVLDLRLQQYSESEVGATLGISVAQVSRLVMAVRAKALVAWGDTPQEVRNQRREQLKREELNTWRRAWLNARRARWRDQGRCSRCGGDPEPGHRMCPECELKGRLHNRLQRRRNGQEREKVLVRPVSPRCQALGAQLEAIPA